VFAELLPWKRVLLTRVIRCCGNVLIGPLLSIGWLLNCDWPAPELIWAIPTEDVYTPIHFHSISFNDELRLSRTGCESPEYGMHLRHSPLNLESANMCRDFNHCFGIEK
jgi:hypothetical protein